MSSGEEDHERSTRSSDKKRRRPNACDMCRRKKIKCDGRQHDTGKCTNCSTYDWDCTLMIESNKRYATGYIEALKTKIDKLEKLVKRLAPNQDFTAEVGFKLTQANWMSPGVLGGPSKVVSKAALKTQSPSAFAVGAPSDTAASHPTPSSASVSSETYASASPSQVPPAASLPGEEQLSDDEDTNIRIKLPQLPSQSRIIESNYFGRASWFGLVSAGFAMCKKLRPDVDLETYLRSTGNWQRPSWINGNEERLLWTGQHRIHGEQASFEFPEPALMNELVDLYFANVNILLPVLHRPTFEANKVHSLQLKSRAFAGVALLVCAIGSRFSKNRDVLQEGDKTWQSAGWRWYIQASIFDTSQPDIPNSRLYHLQLTCLASIYATDISVFYAGIFADIGIKIALDIGAHKRAAYSTLPTLEDEMYKRAFWVLVRLDRTFSAYLGRPCSIQEEDFDVEMPLCVDDEYLTREHVAQQPADKPSLLVYFILSLKLSQIEGLAMRTIYASTKARTHYGFKGKEWITRTIAHLDSLLEHWKGSLPDHLRHDLPSTQEAFRLQALHLQMQHHELQINLYRPFLSSSDPAPLPHLPLSICVSSAHALARITTDLYNARKHQTCLHTLDASPWHVALVLLVGVGNSRLHKVAFDHKRAMADIELMLGILNESHNRWRWAPRFIQLIETLKIMGEVGDDAEAPSWSRKRPYEEDTAVSTQAETVPSSLATSDIMPGIFGDVGWDVLSSFGADSAVMPQSTGAVLGNIDMGALFGFGDLGLPTMGAHGSSVPLGGGPAAGLAAGNFEFGVDGWFQQGFDSAMPRTSEWQWAAPQSGEYPQAGGGTYYAEQWRPR